MRSPRHPYTGGLIQAMPSLEVTEGVPPAPIPGQPPNLAALPPGCPFQPRCEHRRDECAAIPVTLDRELEAARLRLPVRGGARDERRLDRC